MANVIETVEQGARDLLNVGLGLFQTAAEGFDKAQKDIVSGYEELVSKGANENGEFAASARDGLSKGITAVKDAQAKVEETLNLKKEPAAV